ncbi:unnamed protein product [Blepharisma stoltei]|uniref:Palmitoyltransferase n=1 Tax=Blepharisma stoltei TaxID=1481888 RepID=A0AAU9K2I3_9CILI|nr:unnamed protein product [Blepharisma stoltei]
MRNGKRIKRNGFNPPFHPFQIISWLVTTFNICISAIIYIPMLDFIAKAIFGIFYFSSQALVIIIAYKATKCDPTDPWSIEHTNPASNGTQTTQNCEAFCTICNCNVNPKSKHCSRCNRCVDNFDHHCKWLGNCIGQRNYKLFIWLIVSLMINLLVIFVFSVILLENYFNNFGDFQDKANDKLGNCNAVIALIWIMAMFSGVFSLADIYLIGLHIYLAKLGMTTFDYIIYNRNKEKSKNKINSCKDETIVTPDGGNININIPGVKIGKISMDSNPYADSEDYNSSRRFDLPYDETELKSQSNISVLASDVNNYPASNKC